MSPRLVRHQFIAAILFSGAIASGLFLACGGENDIHDTPVGGNVHPTSGDAGPGVTPPPIAPSTELAKLESALGDAGVDAGSLGLAASDLMAEIDFDGPEWRAVGKASRMPIMHSFADSLGKDCNFCHATKEPATDGGFAPHPVSAQAGADAGARSDAGNPYDFDYWTKNKRVAVGMWNEFVVKLRFADGSPLYCDSCHQGKAGILDGVTDQTAQKWMHDNFVDKLVTADGKKLECASCHGTPFNAKFLDQWAMEGPDGGYVMHAPAAHDGGAETDAEAPDATAATAPAH